MNMVEGKRKILVIDDSPFVSRQIEDVLKDSEYQIVGSVKTGELGVEQYCLQRPDLVILDMVLPGIDGIETARRLFDVDGSAKIIMLSSINDISFIEEVRSLGIRFVLSKPVNSEEILNALANMLS